MKRTSVGKQACIVVACLVLLRISLGCVAAIIPSRAELYHDHGVDIDNVHPGGY